MNRRLESIGLVLLAFVICALVVAWTGGWASLSVVARYLVAGAFLLCVLAWRLGSSDVSDSSALIKTSESSVAGAAATSGQRATEPRLLGENHEQNEHDKRESARMQAAGRDFYARELHDEIDTHVCAIKSMGVSITRRAQDPAITEASELIVESVDRIDNAMREVLDRHRPNADAREALSDAVTATVDSFKDGNPDRKITLRLSPEIDSAEPAISNAAHRIAQASLENAILHSGADHIEVSLRVQNNALIVQVADNGVGMPGSLDADRAGGLNSMGDRASAVGGVFEVGKSRLGGVAARASLPLPDEAQAGWVATA